jgi:hypothetical protein
VNETIGFKEWQVVCDALGGGRQTVILRKGGIHEGRAGFSFAHDSFFLFPTRFHALGGEQVREGEVVAMPEWRPGDTIRITHHAQALWAVTLTDWDRVRALEPFHIYSERTVRERFDWQGKGMTAGSIHAALVRVEALAGPWEFPYEPAHGGCRSWLKLPPPPAGWRDKARPVLGDSGFAAIREQVQAAAGIQAD